MISDAEGAASQDLKRLSLGILLLTPLPDVPGFEIHLDKDMPSNCCLLPGGTVELSDGAPCDIIAFCVLFYSREHGHGRAQARKDVSANPPISSQRIKWQLLRIRVSVKRS